MTNDCPLKFTDVVKDFGTLRAVNHVSFEVNKGEVFGLLGPNGAGKTTCISMICTLEEATSGSIEVFGRSVLSDPIGCKKLFGVVPQENVSHGFFTVEEILDFHSGYYGVTGNKEWLDHILDRLALRQHRHKRVRQLSGGMRKRLAIAKSLVHRPPLLLLDEPTAGVDIELRDTLWEFVKELRDEGTTVLLTTHYLEEAELLCDRVGIIDKAQIQKIGETKKLVEELTLREVTISYTGPFNGHVNSPYLFSHSHTQAVFHLPSHLTFQTLIKTAGIPSDMIEDIQIKEGSLEDVVRQLVTFETGGSGR
jgi:ABC-2 type transport system ATP-binding protein